MSNLYIEEPHVRPTHRSSVVAICTYKRPLLLPALLRIVAAQIAKLPPEYQVRVVVIDNDPASSAREQVSLFMGAMQLTYSHQPTQGVGHARNMAFSMVRAGEWLIFFDDDQIPCENWLLSLLCAPDRFEADIFVGPVRPILAPGYPEWAEGAWAWGRPEYADGQTRDHAGFGNIMLSPEALDSPACRVAPPFLQGPGEDTSVTKALSELGFRIAHVLAAAALEPVTEDRMTVSWVVARHRTAGSVWAELSLRSWNGRVRLLLSFVLIVLRVAGLRSRSILTKSCRDEVRSKALLALATGYIDTVSRSGCLSSTRRKALTES